MEFNQKVAEQLIKKQGLSEATMKTWRSRGIPDRYLEGFNIKKPLTQKQIELQELIYDFFDNHPVRYRSTLGEDFDHFYDAKRRNLNLRKEILLRLVESFKDMNLEIEKMFKSGITEIHLVEKVREFGMRPNVIATNGLVVCEKGTDDYKITKYFFSTQGRDFKKALPKKLFDEVLKSIKAMNSKLQEIVAFAKNHL